MWVMIWLIYLYLMCFWLSKFLLWVLFLLETLASEVPKFMTYLALILLLGMWILPGGLYCHTLNTCCGCLKVVAYLKLVGRWLPFIFWPCCGLFLHGSLPLPCLGLAWDFFFLYLYWGSSVLWCHNKLIWATWGSPDTCFICLAVAFELSNFLANRHTLLTGNLSKCCHHWWSWTRNLHPLRKNQKMSLCSILAVSGGILLDSLVPVQCYTIWLCCCSPGRNSSADQTEPELHLIAVYNTPHIFPIWYWGWAQGKADSRTHIGPCHGCHCRLWLLCIVGTPEVLQACILGCFHIWDAICEICDTDYHLL